MRMRCGTGRFMNQSLLFIAAMVIADNGWFCGDE